MGDTEDFPRVTGVFPNRTNHLAEGLDFPRVTGVFLP